MKKYLTELFNSNWFFIVLLGFVVALPLSSAIVSVFGGVLLLTALIEDTWINKIKRLKHRKYLLALASIFVLYVLVTLIKLNSDSSFYDVRKTMFFFVLPLAFVFGKNINSKQKRFLFYTFSVAVFISTLIAFYKWFGSSGTNNFGVHKISLISHIRFSFQLILVAWFFIFLVQQNLKNISVSAKLGLLSLGIYFILFLLFQQSLTGILALGTSGLFFIFYLIKKVESSTKRIFLGIILIGLCIAPAIYITYAIHQFYDIEEVSSKNIQKLTRLGNPYHHDFQNRQVENGHYVYLYVNEEEMSLEWNKVSEYKYYDIGLNGYPVKATLIRYLTSKGLHKDAEGVQQLTSKDISNIENGMANVIFEKHFSLYPRIYQTIWEHYVYTTTGNPTHQSFSQRIEFAKAALTIIKENFWLGVGPGNWREEFTKAYEKNNSQLKKELQGSSHNQYLNYTVKFGFIGFILIMFLLIYPVVRSKRYTDILFLTFLVFMFFANFADSNLESHMGSSFFVFFYCIFMSGEKNYLKLDYASNSSNNHNL